MEASHNAVTGVFRLAIKFDSELAHRPIAVAIIAVELAIYSGNVQQRIPSRVTATRTRARMSQKYLEWTQGKGLRAPKLLKNPILGNEARLHWQTMEKEMSTLVTADTSERQSEGEDAVSVSLPKEIWQRKYEYNEDADTEISSGEEWCDHDDGSSECDRRQTKRTPSPPHLPRSEEKPLPQSYRGKKRRDATSGRWSSG